MAVDVGLCRPLIACSLKPARQLGTPPRCIYNKSCFELLSILQPHTCEAGLSCRPSIGCPVHHSICPLCHQAVLPLHVLAYCCTAR